MKENHTNSIEDKELNKELSDNELNEVSGGTVPFRYRCTVCKRFYKEYGIGRCPSCLGPLKKL